MAVEVIHSLLGRFLIGDGHSGVLADAQGTVLIGVGAAHIGHVQHSQILGGVIQPPAQKNDALQPLFPLHDGGALYLIAAGGDLLHHQRKAGVGDGLFNGLNDVRVERIGYAADHQPDGLGFGPDQVPGAVIGNVVAVLNGGPDLPAHLIADVRTVIEHAGYGADADAALFSDVLDRHADGPSCRTVAKSGVFGNLSGNVTASILPS